MNKLSITTHEEYYNYDDHSSNIIVIVIKQLTKTLYMVHEGKLANHNSFIKCYIEEC